EDEQGTLDEVQIPIRYNLRHAEMDRTIWTGLGWLCCFTATALFGGIYNAQTFDTGAIAPLHLNVKDNYARFVLAQLNPKLAAAPRAARGRARRETAAPPPPGVAREASGETAPEAERVAPRRSEESDSRTPSDVPRPEPATAAAEDRVRPPAGAEP